MTFVFRHWGWPARGPATACGLLLALSLSSVPALAQQTGQPPAQAPAAQAPAAPAAPAPRAAGQIEMNFQNVEIASFLGIMSRAFGVPFVWDDQTVKGKITLQSVQKFSKDDAYRLFETALAMQGYTTLRAQGSPVVQVVPIQDAARLPTPINPPKPGDSAGNVFVTRIITLRYAEPEGVKNTLTPLLSKSTGVATYPPANALILADTEENLARYERIIAELDIPPGDTEFVVIPLKFASARRLAPILTTIAAEVPQGRPARGRQAAGAAGPSRKTTIASDDRTNSLIISGDPADLPPIQKLIVLLDVPGELDVSGFKIYTLKNASATEIARILQQFKDSTAPAAAQDRPRGRATEEGAQAAPQASAAAGGGVNAIIAVDTPTNSVIAFAPAEVLATFDRLVEALDVPGRFQESRFKIYRLNNASAEELAKVLTGVKEGAAAAGERQGGEGGAATQRQQAQRGNQRSAAQVPGIDIAADKATNSLIVFGTAENIVTMDAIVAQLDIRRPQVYVEALIMEITLEKSLQLGINWQGTARAGDAVVGGGFPNAQPQTLPQALAGGQGAALGIIGNEIEFQGQKFTTFSGFIQATRQDLDLNILANPQILTLDNEEAQINVSQVIPVSAKVVRDANLQTTTEFEFKDVGVILSITPQITGSDKVLLTIEQESSSVASQQVNASQDQQAITTLKRTIKSKVLIDDGATMAIGGLIQDNTQETVTKVPCLGDIPVLGWFFKSRSEAVRKTNLIVFLRPRIIETAEDLDRITRGAQERYDATRQPGTDVENQLRESFVLPPRPEPPPPPEEDAEE